MQVEKKATIFDKIKWYPLEKEIKEPWKLYAHRPEGEGEKELLEAHLNQTVYYLEKIYKEKGLNQVRKTLHDVLGVPPARAGVFDEMYLNVFYMHDVGKSNLNFQLKQMKNEYFKGPCEGDTKHALLSAAIYIEYFIGRIKEEGIKGEERVFLHTYMLLNAYVISRHHGYLQSIYELKKKLEDLYEAYLYAPESNEFKLYHSLTSEGLGGFVLGPKLLNRLFEGAEKVLGSTTTHWQSAYPYIYTKLLYSLLVACDFYATSEYMEQEAILDIGNLENLEQWEKAYEKSPTYQAISLYKQQRNIKPIDLKQVTNINVLRSEMFLEAVNQLEKNCKEEIFYLEAPTGSGKTNTSIQLVLTLLRSQQKKKVFYVFPFNTLVEQTKKALDEAFKEERKCTSNMTVVNGITPISNKYKADKENDDEEQMNYNRMLLDRQFFHYPWVITSHVQLFNLLFGVGREDGVGLYQLVNSVIILDEVQSYKNAIWTEMIHFLKAYAKVFNMKIIIMSATLPRLGKLTEDQAEMTSLILDREKYFSHPLFKERVQLDFTLLDVEDVYEALMDKVIQLFKQGNKKILVEFIKKKTAMNFYNDLIERLDGTYIENQVMLLTGDDSTWEREKCIRHIKEEKSESMLLIATQLIEAGVDIDMDYGFKDISLLDAEEQFLGRINRSCKKTNCWAYFFNLDNATVLYKGDYRKNKAVTLLEDKMQQILKVKNFEAYYDEIFKGLIQQKEAFTADNLQDFAKKSLGELKYGEVKKRMQLIDDDIYPCTVFLGITIDIEKEGKHEQLDGRAIWQRYMGLLNNQKLSYAEKKVKMSFLQQEMNCFMWKVKSVEVSYSQKLGELFYIEDGEQYMENGKFNRELLSGSSYELI